MIFDHAEQLANYATLGFDAEAVESFVEKAKNEQLPEGRYDLDGDRLFAMIQEYETKEKSEGFFESHRLYGDIQYVLSGSEVIYGAHVDGLQVTDDRTPQSDIIFYDKSEEETVLTLTADTFAIFLPQDGHMPCCQAKQKEKVRKIVVKFLVA